MEDNLEVLFCDLCNSSIAEKDVLEGRLVRLHGKVIGPCCTGPIAADAAAAGAGPSASTIPAPDPDGKDGKSGKQNDAVGAGSGSGFWPAALVLLVAIAAATILPGHAPRRRSGARVLGAAEHRERTPAAGPADHIHGRARRARGRGLGHAVAEDGVRRAEGRGRTARGPARAAPWPAHDRGRGGFSAAFGAQGRVAQPGRGHRSDAQRSARSPSSGRRAVGASVGVGDAAKS